MRFDKDFAYAIDKASLQMIITFYTDCAVPVSITVLFARFSMVLSDTLITAL